MRFVELMSGGKRRSPGSKCLVTQFLWCLHTTLTWAGHAPLQVPQRLPGQCTELVPEPPLAVQRQVPEARLPLAVPALQVAGLAEAAVEAKVVTDAVLPAVRGRLEEGEVLSGREAGAGGVQSRRWRLVMMARLQRWQKYSHSLL